MSKLEAWERNKWLESFGSKTLQWIKATDLDEMFKKWGMA
jgi:hypothetical protein